LQPYSDLVNQKLALERDVLLVKNRASYVFKKHFLIVETDAVLDEGITEKQVIKAGTQLILNNAELFTNGTSCTTTRVVFGSISNKNGEWKFEHVWGDEQSTLSIDQPNYFTFVKPVWHTKKHDSNKRYLFKK